MGKLLDYLQKSRLEKGELLLSVDNLSKVYGRNSALDQVSFEVNAGECIGLIGPNGGGKTTLINLLLGYIPPSKGCIDYYSVLQDPVKRGLNLGVMLDTPGVPYGLSIRGYFYLEADFRSINRKVVDKYINDFDLASRAKQSFKSLSQGWKRKVLLVSLVMISSELLILDEPTNSLDIENIAWLREVIKARTECGLTTIVSSHNHHELAQVITRALILKQTLRYDGQLSDIAKTSEDLEKAYFRLTNDSVVEL